MVDEKKNNPEEHHEDFEQEFDFESESDDILAPEETKEPVSTETQVPPAGAGAGAPRKLSVLPAIIGVIVVIFLIYKGWGWLHKKPPEQPKIVKQEAQPAKLAPPPTSTTGPQIAPPPQAPIESPLEESVNKIQKKMDEQNQATQQQIKNLEKDLASSVQSSINASKGVSSLQQEIASLNNLVQNLSFELKSLKEQMAKKPVQKEHPHKHRPHISEEGMGNPNMSVYAIIPGRAWLRGPNGKTVTVTEGDSVGEYGKVLKIDATNGVVVTSTGVTLR